MGDGRAVYELHDEKKFIDGLGGWSVNGFEKSYRWWLVKYIQVNQARMAPLFVRAVGYARQKLANLR